jgi:hypothetical protein
MKRYISLFNMLIKAQIRVDVQHHSFLNSVPDGVDGQHHAPPLLQETVQTPNVQEAGWTPGTVWVGVEKKGTSFPSPVFETRTFQPVASRYANYHKLYMLLYLRRKI